MLGKLLKYDFRALSRVLLPLQLCVLVAGIVGSFLINFAIRNVYGGVMSGSYASGSGEAALQTIIQGTSTLIGILILGLVFSSLFVTLFLIAHHLYKSFLTDEAYLTFTLPISASKHLLSKTLCGFFWTLINGIILVVVLVIFSWVGFSVEGLFNTTVLRVYSELIQELMNPLGILFVFEFLVLALVGALVSVLQIYFSLIVGGALARTHKVLAAIGIYFATSMIVQTVTSIITFALTFNTASYSMTDISSYYFSSAQPFLIGVFALHAALVVVFYFTSYHILKTKVNID